jgi:hypothetical protein
MAATISPGGHHAARAGAKLSLWAVEIRRNFSSPHLFSGPKAEPQMPTALGWRRLQRVHWNNHSYYSCYRVARRL